MCSFEPGGRTAHPYHMKCPAIHNEELRVEWVVKPTTKPSKEVLS
jgi:hypothetical protein